MTTPYRGMRPGEFLPAGDVHRDDPPDQLASLVGRAKEKARHLLEQACIAHERLLAAQACYEDMLAAAVDCLVRDNLTGEFYDGDGHLRSLIVGQHVVEYEPETGQLRITRAAVL